MGGKGNGNEVAAGLFHHESQNRNKENVVFFFSLLIKSQHKNRFLISLH